jgi:hypothetical protein
MGTSSLFADLAGSPPTAQLCTVVRDFVVLANDANSPHEVIWSGFEDSTTWTSNVKQSDSQTLQDNGIITAITGGDVGYVFQQHQITRMSYVGPPLYFQFEAVVQARGCAASGSCLNLGGNIFFWDGNGFFLFDGNTTTPIGAEKIDNWFSANLAPNTQQYISSSFDASNKLILWSFVSNAASDRTTPDSILAFHWPSQRWSYILQKHDMIFHGLTQGTTLEGLNSLFATLEAVPISLDSPVWQGGALATLAFNTSHFLAQFQGTSLQAVVNTSEFEPVKERRAMVTNARPLTDTTSATVVVQSRERLADNLNTSQPSSMQSNGDTPVFASGRYHRLQATIPAGVSWTYIQGFDIDAVDDGLI